MSTGRFRGSHGDGESNRGFGPSCETEYMFNVMHIGGNDEDM